MVKAGTAPARAGQGPSEEQVQALLAELGVSPETNIIGVLQNVQEHFGYLPGPALEQISRRTKTPLSRIYGVVSFYAQFHTSPQGRHTIRCCRGTACRRRATRAPRWGTPRGR